MSCGRFTCKCAPRSKPFTCKCKPAKPKRDKNGQYDYFSVIKCTKCKTPISRDPGQYAGTSVLEKIIAATDTTPPEVRVPVLKGQKRLL